MNDIREQVSLLSAWLAETDIARLELTGPACSIRLRRSASGIPEVEGELGDGIDSEEGLAGGSRTDAVPHPSRSSSAVLTVRAGSVGTLLHRHPLHAEALVSAGQQVAAGQSLALLRIGAVLLVVTSPRAGTVVRIHASHETTVGWGDPLFDLG